MSATYAPCRALPQVTPQRALVALFQPKRARRMSPRELCSLWAFMVWQYLRMTAIDTWRDMPGPWYVKVALVAICLAIPGPQDELLLILFVKACRAYRRRHPRS